MKIRETGASIISSMFLLSADSNEITKTEIHGKIKIRVKIEIRANNSGRISYKCRWRFYEIKIRCLNDIVINLLHKRHPSGALESNGLS